MDAWDPGGRQAMSNAIIENVPQVQGKSLQLICESMDVAIGEGLCG